MLVAYLFLNMVKLVFNNRKKIDNFLTRQWWGFLENKDEIIDRFLDYYSDMKSDDLTTRTKGAVKGMTEAWFGAASNWEAKIHR